MMRALAGRAPTSYRGHASTASLRQMVDPSNEIVSFVEQFPSFLPNVKARHVVDVVINLVSDRVRNRGVENALESHARSCESELGVDSFADTSVKWLSGGEQKRLAILLSLICCPAILFLDEPVSGLPHDMAKKVILALRGAADKVGTTVILSIHQPSADILALADNLIETNNQGFRPSKTTSCADYDTVTDAAENKMNISSLNNSNNVCLKHVVDLCDWPNVEFWPAHRMAPIRISHLLLMNRLRSPSLMPINTSLVTFILVLICGLLYKEVALDRASHLEHLKAKNLFLLGLAASTSVGLATEAASDYQFVVQHVFDGHVDIISCIIGLCTAALSNMVLESLSLTLAATLTGLVAWRDFTTFWGLVFCVQYSLFSILMLISTRVFKNVSSEQSDLVKKCIWTKIVFFFFSGWPIDIYSLYKPLRWIIVINPFYYALQSFMWLDLHNEELKCERKYDATNYNVGEFRRALRSKNGESFSLDISGLFSDFVGDYMGGTLHTLFGVSNIQGSCSVDGDDVYSSLRLGRMNNNVATRRNTLILFIIGAVSTILIPLGVALRLNLLRVRRLSIKCRLRRVRLSFLFILVGLCLVSRYEITFSDPHSWLPTSHSKISYDTQLAEIAPNLPGRIDCDTIPITAVARFLGDPVIGTSFRPKSTMSIFAHLPTLNPPVSNVETRESCCSRNFQSLDEITSYFPETMTHYRNLDDVMTSFWDDSGETLLLSWAMNAHTLVSSTFFRRLDTGTETIAFLSNDFPVLSSSDVATTFEAHNTSLSAELSQGRLFLTNLTILKDAQMEVGYTIKAPYALYYLRDDGKYETVAIQFGPDPTRHSVLTRNGLSYFEQWVTVRYALRHAIFTVIRIAHIVQIHYFLFAVRTAQFNQLSESHPTRAVLEPFLQNILGLTCVTQQSGLILSGLSTAGMRFDNRIVDIYLTGNEIMNEANTRPFVYFNHALQTSLAGTSSEVRYRSPDSLHPSFSNITAIWEITLDFMHSFVDLHYTNDGAVANDDELQNFITELIAESTNGGGGAGPLAPTANNAETRTNLAEILASIHFAILVHGFPRLPTHAHILLETLVCPPAVRDFNLVTVTSIDTMLTQVLPTTDDANDWINFLSYVADAPVVESLWTIGSEIDLGVGNATNQAFHAYQRRLFQDGYLGQLKVEAGVAI